jgi:ferredoxin
VAAKVDDQKCTGCGACVDVCPVDAITLSHDKAVIDRSVCTACGQCVEECPNEAISIS